MLDDVVFGAADRLVALVALAAERNPYRRRERLLGHLRALEVTPPARRTRRQLREIARTRGQLDALEEEITVTDKIKLAQGEKA